MKRSWLRKRIAAWLHLHPQLRRVIVCALAPVLRLTALMRSPEGVMRHPREALDHLLHGRELDNLTYDIANTDELVPVLASTLGCSEVDAARYLDECVNDTELHDRLTQRLATRPDRKDVPYFGRRYGWYIAVRVAKPRLVVETGSHDGLGSALLSRALERNAEEGHPGELLSFDINPSSGWLLDPPPAHWQLVVGDAKRTLPAALRGREVDMFIHDSLHTIEHEKFEFDVAVSHASPAVILITDNAHETSVLRDRARAAGAPFGQFDERPRNHWYKGASLGIAALGRAAVTAD
jgi:Methyltransferase domain